MHQTKKGRGRRTIKSRRKRKRKERKIIFFFNQLFCCCFYMNLSLESIYDHKRKTEGEKVQTLEIDKKNDCLSFTLRACKFVGVTIHY